MFVKHVTVNEGKVNSFSPQYPTVGVPPEWLLMLCDVVKWTEFIFIPAKGHGHMFVKQTIQFDVRIKES